jgi:DNA-directed RNA polymerase specialized sigma24 family protein
VKLNSIKKELDMRLRWFSRRAKITPEPLSPPEAAQPSPELSSIAHSALRCIPLQLRIPLMMVYYERIPQRQAARQLRITPAELRERINQALVIFREEMSLRGWEHDGERVPRQAMLVDDPPAMSRATLPRA